MSTAVRRRGRDAILIVTSAGDVHADYIIDRLDRLGVAFIRFHPDGLLRDYCVSTRPGLHSPWEILESRGRRIDLEQISTIYFRKPFPPRAPRDVASSAHDFCESEASYLLNSLLNWFARQRTIRWVNHYRRIHIAEDKPAQLHVARSVGLQTPETLITTDPVAAFEFYQRLGDVVVKAMVGRGLPSGRTIYTTQLGSDLTLDAFEGVRAAPTMFQAFVRKVCDVRVTVVGTRIFAVRIDSQSKDETATDFRAGQLRDISHTPTNLPSSLANRLRELVRRFGLVHAEVDLGMAADGSLMFFEMNPNGQWLWCERQAGLPIADAFVSELTAARL